MSPKSKLDFSMPGISRFGIVFKIVVSFFIITMGVYLHLMQVPHVDIVDTLFSMDKLAHIVFFYLSSLWFFLIVRPDQALVIIIFMTVYAFSLESVSYTHLTLPTTPYV